jgi:hypothetical protein
VPAPKGWHYRILAAILTAESRTKTSDMGLIFRDDQHDVCLGRALAYFPSGGAGFEEIAAIADGGGAALHDVRVSARSRLEADARTELLMGTGKAPESFPCWIFS